MSVAVKILIGFVIFILVAGLSCVGTSISTNNSCVEFEAIIEAQYKNNQNVYDNFWKKVKETAQVPDKFKEDTLKLFTSVMSGRYGKNGSKAMWQWLKESNPTLDSSLYIKVQQLIEAGRNDFQKNQTILIDKKAQYDIYRKTAPRSILIGFLGFPKIDLSKFDIVTSDKTQNAFEKKNDKEIKIF